MGQFTLRREDAETTCPRCLNGIGGSRLYRVQQFTPFTAVYHGTVLQMCFRCVRSEVTNFRKSDREKEAAARGILEEGEVEAFLSRLKKVEKVEKFTHLDVDAFSDEALDKELQKLGSGYVGVR